jgi:hypothetical protein
MLPRLVSNSWIQAVSLKQPPSWDYKLMYHAQFLISKEKVCQNS